MADGITVPLTGAGDATAKVATDDAGTPGHVQIIKLAIGTDGSATLIGADAANGLDVDVTRVQGTVTTAPGVSGGGTEATAQRVTIANDSTGLISVDDNGGSLTVDGTVAVSSTTPGTAATYLGIAEDAAHASGDVGVLALGVRNDAGSVLAGTTGDYIPLSTDAAGALRVTGGGGGTEYVEDAVSAADPTGQILLARRRDTLVTTEVSADGDNIALNATNKGELRVNNAQLPAALGQTTKAASTSVTLASDEDAFDVTGSVSFSGSLPAGTNNIGDVDVLSVTPGTGATALGKAEDAAHTTGDTGVMALGVRKDTPSAIAGTDGDYVPPIMDPTGRMYVNASIGGESVMVAGAALTPKFAVITASASGATSIVAAVTSKKIRVLSWNLVCNAAVNVKWLSAATDKTGLHYFAANGGISVGFNPFGHFETAATEALNINLSGAVAVGGSLVYVEV
jgi:hypothetical protein